MNAELQAVYRERVLEHSRNPHNFGRPENSDWNEAIGFNPLCGDKLTIYLQITDGIIKSAVFEGNGCAISMASASIMTDALQGCEVAKAGPLIESARRMLTDSAPAPAELEDFKALEGVRAYPSRIKCATLAWSAAEAALLGDEQNSEHVSTE